MLGFVLYAGIAETTIEVAREGMRQKDFLRLALDAVEAIAFIAFENQR